MEKGAPTLEFQYQLFVPLWSKYTPAITAYLFNVFSCDNITLCSGSYM